MASRRSLDTVSPDPGPAPDSKARRPARSRKSDSAPSSSARLTPEARHALIAEAAYLRAERRGFAPGHETDDWLAAEAEVDALLRVEPSRQ
ncbi:MAG TPA: DUF2934 domain-containing protein [Steroidobacteraceae bacterium]|nr:DUF2934 domain-containing protein [Steroidobacteraceae bacterium]